MCNAPHGSHDNEPPTRRLQRFDLDRALDAVDRAAASSRDNLQQERLLLVKSFRDVLDDRTRPGLPISPVSRARCRAASVLACSTLSTQERQLPVAWVKSWPSRMHLGALGALLLVAGALVMSCVEYAPPPAKRAGPPLLQVADGPVEVVAPSTMTTLSEESFGPPSPPPTTTTPKATLRPTRRAAKAACVTPLASYPHCDPDL
jgi:hypothetical protein